MHTLITILHKNSVVPSYNIGVKCVTFVSETFTRYGSNITNVWQEIFTPMTLTFFCEVVRKKYENPSIFVKVTAKNQWHLFSAYGVVVIKAR